MTAWPIEYYVGSTRLYIPGRAWGASDLCFITIASNTNPSKCKRYSAIQLRIQYCSSEHAVHTRIFLLGHHDSHRCWTLICVSTWWAHFRITDITVQFVEGLDLLAVPVMPCHQNYHITTYVRLFLDLGFLPIPHSSLVGCFSYGTCHKLLVFFPWNLQLAITEFLECLQNFLQNVRTLLCRLAAGTYQLRNTFLGIWSCVASKTIFILLVKAA